MRRLLPGIKATSGATSFASFVDYICRYVFYGHVQFLLNGFVVGADSRNAKSHLVAERKINLKIGPEARSFWFVNRVAFVLVGVGKMLCQPFSRSTLDAL